MSGLKQFVGQVVGVVLLGAVVLAAAALVVVPKVVGAKPLTVLSGSMAPSLAPGDVVIVRPVSTEQLHRGDIITFQPQSGKAELTTHRIAEVHFTSSGVEYLTKGDANDVTDQTAIKAEQVKGEVWYAVPKVGYLSVWLAGSTLRTAVDLGAASLLLYGGYLVTAGFLDRRRKAVAA